MSRIIHDMTNLSRVGAQYRTEALEPMGLKGCHASYLMEICACPGISQDRLARRICINKSNIARQLVVLEEGGFVLRRPSATDKRVMELYPTDKTLALLPRLREIMDCWERYLTQDMSQEDFARLAPMLEAMMNRADAWVDRH